MKKVCRTKIIKEYAKKCVKYLCLYAPRPDIFILGRHTFDKKMAV